MQYYNNVLPGGAMYMKIVRFFHAALFAAVRAAIGFAILMCPTVQSHAATDSHLLWSKNGAVTEKRLMEKLDRGLIAMRLPENSGNFVSWRFLGDEGDLVSYKLYRDGELIAAVSDRTSYTDAEGAATSHYEVAAVIEGVEQPKEAMLTDAVWASAGTTQSPAGYFDINLVRPKPMPAVKFRNVRGDYFNANGQHYYPVVPAADIEFIKQSVSDYLAGTITKEQHDANVAEFRTRTDALGLDDTGGAGPTLRALGYEDNKVPYSIDTNGRMEYVMAEYGVNDAAIGDLNGDGHYELVIKWEPTNAVDSMYSYRTSSPAFVDAYTLTGELLWRINVGYNIRAGAHDTQMLCYDFNRDGKAELILRTADGTASGTVDQAGYFIPRYFVGPPEAARIDSYILNNDPDNVTKYWNNVLNTYSIVWEDPKYGAHPPAVAGPENNWGEDSYITTGAYKGNVSDQRWCKVYTYGPMGGVGKEYITVFDGETGAIIDSTPYEFAINQNWWGLNPICRRGASVSSQLRTNGEDFWITKNDQGSFNYFLVGNADYFGDTIGNRGNRFLAAVALLDGVNPAAIIGRGYYARITLAAYTFAKDHTLQLDSIYDSAALAYPERFDFEGRGNHNLAIGDVDNDGCDEIMYGAMAFKKGGGSQLDVIYAAGQYMPIDPPISDSVNYALMQDELKTTGRFSYNHHGDAIHLFPYKKSADVSKPDPLALFSPHEDAGDAARGFAAGYDAHAAATGVPLVAVYRPGDTGRGTAGNSDPRYPASAEVWAGGSTYNVVTGERTKDAPLSVQNFMIYWDGDLMREILDGRTNLTVSKIDSAGNLASLFASAGYSINGTKSNPVISADMFGDWREEFITLLGDSQTTASGIRVFTTAIPTDFKIRTLMHDPMYRLQIAHQNVAYNQPPHPSFFLGYENAPISNENALPLPAKRDDTVYE